MTFAHAVRGRAAAVVVVVATATLGAAALAAPAPAAQGSGNPQLAVSRASLPADQTSTVSVTGTDYLVPPHEPGVDVFGGVYVFFGWVAGGGWGPSNRGSSSTNGHFGATYSYPGDGGDASTRDDGSGTVRLVSFTPGGESGNATPFHMDDAGNWSTTLNIRGATYEFSDPATGAARVVNCLEVQCGVFTIGAHGKASATNEKFVPISFVGAPSAPPPVGTPGAGGGVAAQGSGTGAPAGGGGGGAGSTGAGPGAATATTVITAPPATTTVPRSATGPAGSPDDPIALGPTISTDESSTNVPAIAAIGGAGLLIVGGAWYWRRRVRMRA